MPFSRKASEAAIAALLVLGVAALGYAALAPAEATRDPRTPEEAEVLAEIEAPAVRTKLVPASQAQAPAPAAGGAAPAAPPTPQPTAVSRPPLRVAAPLEAQSVSGSRPLSGGGISAARFDAPSSSAASAGPWTVVLVADAEVDAWADALRPSLSAKGILVSNVPAAKSDAVLALVAGTNASAWYCDWPGAGSAALAASLGLMSGAAGRSEPPALDCEALQGAWARTPAVALTLPSPPDTSAAQLLTDALAAYFNRYGAAQRRSRDAARLVWPAAGEITSTYGPAHPLGIDIGQRSGPIRAASEGVVYYAGGNACCSYGRFVVIDGPDGMRTLYAHLESIAVKAGDRVRAGQTIGEGGCTGSCLGPHLHFEVFDRGVRRNPMGYLP